MAPTRTPAAAVVLLTAAVLALSACAPSPTGDSAASATDREAVRAVTTAESDAGGRAFELDTDDGRWHVHVAVGDREVEVEVSADGSRVTASDDSDDLDADDRGALDAATTTLADAVRIAAAQATGVARIEEVQLERENGVATWQVDFDGGTSVNVSGADGSIR